MTSERERTQARKLICILSLLTTASWNVENIKYTIGPREEPADLAEYRAKVMKHYQSRLSSSEHSAASDEVASDGVIVPSERNQHPTPGEDQPLRPNNCIMYKPTLLGLDQARRDCRFEMIKIVQEVDAVTQNPKVAIDPNRIHNYLSPIVFRMLLPVCPR